MTVCIRFDEILVLEADQEGQGPPWILCSQFSIACLSADFTCAEECLGIRIEEGQDHVLFITNQHKEAMGIQGSIRSKGNRTGSRGPGPSLQLSLGGVKLQL